MFVRMPAPNYWARPEQTRFPAMAAHIRQQVEVKSHVPDLGKLRQAPQPVQTVFWLWRFDCEAESGGFATLMLSTLGMEAPQYHSALADVGAMELRDRLEAAIPIAAQHHAEFMRLPDTSWFLRFPLRVEHKTLRDVDRGTGPLYEDLRARVARFIDAHAEVFLVDE